MSNTFQFVIAFLPRRKSLLISWLQSSFTVILEPKKIKSVIVSIVAPSISHEVMGQDAMILLFWILSFKSAFSLSSFTFIKNLFNSSSLSAIRIVSSACLRLLLFLLVILIPACNSLSLAFYMIYSTYKLNKQRGSVQIWYSSLPILNQSVVSCLVVTVASGIPENTRNTCLIRNQYAGQEAAVTSWHGTMDWFKTWKGVGQGYILP